MFPLERCREKTPNFTFPLSKFKHIVLYSIFYVAIITEKNLKSILFQLIDGVVSMMV